MKLTVNGEQQVLEKEKVTVSDLLKINDVEMPDMVSVQLNGAFVNRDDFGQTDVNEDDQIDFLYFMGGGA